MNAFTRAGRAVDDFQQRWPVLALPIAVWKRFNDDQAGNLAALIAFNAFVSIFPLLLVLVTVLNIVLKNDPALHATLLNSALAQYPVIGPQIKSNLGSISGSGLPLAIGTVLLLLGARGVANAMQHALCKVWEIDQKDRPGFPLSQLWPLALLFTVAIGFVATTFLSGVIGGAGHLLTGAGALIGATLISLALNLGMFWLGFRLATFFRVRWRDLLIGAIIAAVIWQLLQVVGGYVVSHQLHRASELYGTFGLVLGLIAWLYLQAEVTLYAVEIDVVLARRLWPRSLLTDADADADAAPDPDPDPDLHPDPAPDLHPARDPANAPASAPARDPDPAHAPASAPAPAAVPAPAPAPDSVSAHSAEPAGSAGSGEPREERARTASDNGGGARTRLHATERQGRPHD
jgi:membrane protein